MKAHQDESTDVSSMPQQVALNVRMDVETKQAYDLPQQWQTLKYVPVGKAEGCNIYIGDKKITSNLHLLVLERWHEREAREYLLFTNAGETSQTGPSYYDIHMPALPRR